MKGCNRALKKLKSLFVIISIILICNVTHVYATDGETEDDGTKTKVTNLPYIEMKVKSTKGDEGNQVLVEMWGSNFTDLEGIEVVFTYNNEKLIPSNINSNKVIDNLDEIKYDKRPANYNNAQTPFEKDQKKEFNKKSKELLLKSFAFDDKYKDLLENDIFLYLAPNGKNEAVQFKILRQDYLQEITATEPVLIGTFSFKLTEGTALEEDEFNTMRIKVNCNDDDSEEGFVQYERSRYAEDGILSNKCEDLIEFTYEKYGSISGTVETGYFDGTSFVQIGKNIATIKLYKASDVSEFDWTEVGAVYNTNRLKLQPIVSGEDYELCYRPDSSKIPEIEPVEITTTEEDLGKFKLDKVLFGEYIVVIDKLNYADYIITNVIIDGTNKDIDLGNVQIEAGDLNKDGIIDKIDRTIFLILYANAKSVEADLGIIAFDLNDDGNIEKSSEKMDRTYMLQILANSLGKTIKKVESLEE